RAASPFTSGTTSGTPGSWRNALDLSTTMAPASTAAGASARDWAEPAEKNASSMPRNGASLATSTGMASPRNVTWRPAERADANARSERTGKLRSSRIRSVVVPAAPVAPTSAIACPAPMLDGGRLDVSGTQQPLIVQDRLGCHIRKVDRRRFLAMPAAWSICQPNRLYRGITSAGLPPSCSAPSTAPRRTTGRARSSLRRWRDEPGNEDALPASRWLRRDRGRGGRSPATAAGRCAAGAVLGTPQRGRHHAREAAPDRLPLRVRRWTRVLSRAGHAAGPQRDADQRQRLER